MLFYKIDKLSISFTINESGTSFEWHGIPRDDDDEKKKFIAITSYFHGYGIDNVETIFVGKFANVIDNDDDDVSDGLVKNDVGNCGGR
ncbi:hypothetical protein DERP_012044 [Dermatophagoides pteronyssinus]|uniref:Uncharacterized protein n=1 Tax=Dermatophagoides pteronyssinus TaxID=6956 RepID=A0ABQ8IVP8_DERPT|nr:hypothetical protein DERP_012044 [Dermatophagoides pteronyssinus]